MKKTNLMKILLLSAAFVLASCVTERTPSKTSTSEIVNPTSENVDPTSENVDPTSEDVNPTSEHQDPTSEIVDPTSEDVSPSSEDISEVGYYVVGSFNGWTAAIGNADYKMEKQSDGFYLLAGLNLEKDTALKVASSENVWFPDPGDNYVVPENGQYTVTFSPEGGLEGYHGGYFMVVRTGDYQGDIVETEYFLVGSFNNWTEKDAEFKLEKMDEQKNNKDQYKSNVVTFAASTTLQVVSSKGNWYPGGDSNNYTVAADGDYIVYFVPEGGIQEEGWHHGFFYLALQGSEHSSEEITSGITSEDSSDTGDTSEVTEVSYYATGFAGWGKDEQYKLTKMDEQKEGKDQYESPVIHLEPTNAVKIVSSEDIWYPDGMGNEYVVTADGDYKIYFCPAGGITAEGWHYGFFYVALQGGSSSSSEEISSEISSDITSEEVAVANYYLAGSFNGWSPNNESYKFVKADEQIDGKDVYVITLNLLKDSEFKYVTVVEGQENVWNPGANVKVNEHGKYTITICPEGGMGEGWAEGKVLATRIGDYEGEIPETHYYVSGYAGWTAESGTEMTKMTEQKEGKDQYEATLTLGATNLVKIVDSNGHWYPDGSGNEYQITEGGEYTIYFCPEGGIEGWHYGYFFVAAAQQSSSSEEISSDITSEDSSNTGDTSEVTEVSYYVTGFAGWGMDEQYKLTKMGEQKEGKDQYESAVIHLEANNKVKVVSSEETWYPDGMGNEYNVTADGDYIIYFCPEGGITAEGWHYGFFYVALQGGSSSSSEEISSEISSDITSEEVAVANYYLAGSFNGWSPNNESYKFVKADEQIDGKDVYVITLNLLKDSEFKYVTVVEGQENVWNPGANVKVNEHGKYTITICPEGGMGEGWAEGKVLATRIGDYEGEIPETHYYVSGYAGWTAQSGTEMTKMTEQKEGKDQYEASLHLNANMVIKVLDSNGHWYPDGSGNEYQITADGDYKVYFCPEGGITAEGWHYGYFYVALQEAEQSSSSAESTGSSEEITSSGEVTSTIYYVVGSFNEWSANEDYALTKMTDQKDGKDQYESAVLDIPANSELKIFSSDDQWFPAVGDNATINDAGQYKIYFVPAGGITEEGWISGYFYIAHIVNNLETTMAYAGGSTTNMDGTNQAALLGLDAEMFSVKSELAENSTLHVGLNKDGTIRLYDQSRETLVIKGLTANINSMKFAEGSVNVNLCVVTIGGEVITPDEDGVYHFSAPAGTEIRLVNTVAKGGGQVQLKGITLGYTLAA